MSRKKVCAVSWRPRPDRIFFAVFILFNLTGAGFLDTLKNSLVIHSNGGRMEKLSFYDVKTKSKFESADYRVQEKGGRFFAVVKSPAGTHECWRVLGKDQAQKLKK